MTRLQEWKQKRLPDREIARAIVRAAAKAEGKKVDLQALANRIGDLRVGRKLEWWKGRPAVRQLVADYLEAEPHELVATPVPPGSLNFPEFPDLPPLLPTEDPCRLSSSGWMLQEALARPTPRKNGRPRPRWIVAPPGAGKSLSVRVLAVRHPGVVVTASVTTLDEAVALSATSLPLVVEVEEGRPGKDALDLRAFEERKAATAILSAGEFPEPLWSGPGSPFGMSASGWEIVRAQNTPGWRDRMIEWIDRRLEASPRETLFEKSHVVEWLNRNDPRGDLVTTPGALLALCADFHRHGAGGDPVHVRARRWVRDVVPTMVSEDAPATWRTRTSPLTYEALVASHLHRVTERHGGLRGEDWAELVPASHSPGTEERPGEVVIVEHFRRSGLLRGDVHGVRPYPSWVENGLLVGEILPRFDDANLTWGVLAADESRRPLVDDALDALLPGALWALIGLVVDYAGARSVAVVGAVEGTMAAIARRLDGVKLTVDDRHLDAVQRLVLRQLDELVADPMNSELRPFTRPDRDEWLATAWTISLRVPKPPSFQRSDLDWELPRWAASLSVAGLPRLPSSTFVADPTGGAPSPGQILSSPGVTITEIDYADGLVGVASPAVARVTLLTLEVVDRIEREPLPLKLPRVLLPALFLTAQDRGWDLQASHLDTLHESWDEAFLGLVAVQQPPERRRDLAGRLWRLAAHVIVEGGAAPVAERVALLQGRHPGIVRFVLDNVDPELVAATARTHGTHRRPTAPSQHFPSDPRLMLLLPRAARHGALRGWLDGAAGRGARYDEARELVPLLDVEDMELALDLVRAADRDVAAEFTSLVWTSAPALAREEATRAIEEGLPSAEGWCHAAPRGELPFLVGLLSLPSPLPAWARRWALRRMGDAGDAAEAIFQLATTP